MILRRRRRPTVDEDYIRRSEAIGITKETGAWETKKRLRELAAADVRAVVRAHNNCKILRGSLCVPAAAGAVLTR